MVKNSPEYMRNYYHTHKDKYTSLIRCDVCKKDIQKGYLWKHNKSQSHIKNEQLNINTTKDEKEEKMKEIKDQINKLSDELKIISRL